MGWKVNMLMDIVAGLMVHSADFCNQFFVYLFIILMCALLQYSSPPYKYSALLYKYSTATVVQKKKKENPKYFNTWCFPDLEMYFNSALVL